MVADLTERNALAASALKFVRATVGRCPAHAGHPRSATSSTTARMKQMLQTRFSVPPNPAAILDGDVSRRLRSRAPRPTAIPDRPKQRIRHINWWLARILGETRSITSLSKIRSEQGMIDPPTANRNLAP